MHLATICMDILKTKSVNEQFLSELPWVSFLRLSIWL